MFACPFGAVPHVWLTLGVCLRGLLLLQMGLNGVDNGQIWFDNVRVPRGAMLDRCVRPCWLGWQLLLEGE